MIYRPADSSVKRRSEIKSSNKIFSFTRCTMQKRITSWRNPSPRHCARAIQILSTKCCSGGELLATVSDLTDPRNLRPTVPENIALPLHQLAFLFNLKITLLKLQHSKPFNFRNITEKTLQNVFQVTGFWQSLS